MDKHEIYRLCNNFYEFDSAKIIEEVKSLNSELEQIQFFEGIKMEFDIASHFCKCQIDRMQHYREFKERFSREGEDQSLKNNPYFNNHEIFIKEQFTTDADHPWSWFFYREDDYDFFVNTLKSFFNNDKHADFSKIKIKPKCLTRLCNILHDVYFFCSPLKQLKDDKKFLTLIKTLSPFSALIVPRIYNKLIHY